MHGQQNKTKKTAITFARDMCLELATLPKRWVEPNVVAVRRCGASRVDAIIIQETSCRGQSIARNLE